MKALHDYLAEDQLKQLRAAYKRDEMLTAIGVPLPTLVPASKEYIAAIELAFYPHGRESTVSPAPSTLSVRERELCLLVLLATHGSQHNLAVHIYLGLMEGISPYEVGNLLLLAGIYSGVPQFASGSRTAAMTLMALAKAVDDNEADAATNRINPGSILDRLKKTFPYL